MASFEFNYTTKILLCLLLMGINVTGILQPVIPLNFTQIAKNSGLSCEEYEITTEDGYILDMFRVPGDQSRPVLLLSGAFGTADDYITRGNISLPYVLAGAGYDVWVGSVRGSRYGRHHVSLDPDADDDQFWDFTFHEYAVYDTAAMVDFVLNSTKQQQLSSIAWSLGTTSFYILGSERPEYIKKVKLVISFAPICYLHNSPAFAASKGPGAIAEFVIGLENLNEIFGENSTEITLFRNTCTTPATAYYVCLQLSFLTYGFNSDEIERDYAPIIFAHYPSSMSGKTLSHLLQVLRTRRFANYDYGRIKNRQIYGSPTPRKYDLSKNNMTVVLISGKNDQTSTLADVELLKDELPNIVDHIIMENEKFNHIDFVHGKNTYQVLFKPIVLDLLTKYN